jgi:hypothetical protein
MIRQKRVNSSSCDALPESLITFIQEFSSIDRYVICRFGGFPVHELLLYICRKFMVSPLGPRIVIAPKLRASLLNGQLQMRVQRPWLIT